jgi:hypothetical protein
MPAGTSAQSSQLQTAQKLSATGDDLEQMRTDLNQMEGLLNNMSSEIEFLHDQNLQILLRTNAQIWTILLRDLRKQVAREEQRARQEQPAEKSVPKPKP